MLTTTYLLNRCPENKLKNITPKESWSGFIPTRSHLRVFDLMAYIHVLDHIRKMQDNKGDQMILVGYHSTSGYKIYDTINKIIVISKDMIFAELGDWKHAITNYRPTVISYHNVGIVATVFGG